MTRDQISSLTPAELRVCKCLAEGLSMPAAAKHLACAVRTVDVHRNRAYRKLGIDSNTKLVHLFLHLKLISPLLPDWCEEEI